MAPQPIHILPRDGGGSSKTGLYVAGFVIAGVVMIGAVAWLTIRFLRQRARWGDEDNRGAAFLNVRGLVREDGEKGEVGPLPNDIHGIQSNMFSKANIGAQGVVMPSRALTRPNATNQEIIDYHADQGNLPRSFAPFSFALQAGNTPSIDKRCSAGSTLTVSRHSFLSVSSRNRFSIASAISTSSQSGRRKVRQIFDPVLPDEPVISLGERLTVMQSFDDGWCIIGRPGMLDKDEIELGAVPAWCFLKPVKGLRAERPMRIDSLGVTVQFDTPNPERDQIISWSNF